ncbi:ABC transporter substrate-binding protein [Fluviispira multicolorata]|uniref:ABC transporter substrate-binding protein n=1 Tax=Fluviispira multicolorata TaxID=2654512 RepID=A0A833JFX9_9BACT|nr:ABC transporter substrate-binding protein [Fluviispira multicolorata]KAB8031841.1 ABC transporter substrate-binding protein [Fluviispira multicolorata]
MNFKNKKIVTYTFAALVGLIGSLNANALDAKVGVLLPLTGTQAFYGKEAKNGIDLARQELTDSDINLKIFVEDTQSTPVEAAKGINKLITSDRVNVIIAEVISSNAIAAASITEKAKIPMLSPAATNDAVTLGKKYVYRTCFIDSFQGVVMADFASQNLKAKTAIILEDSDSDYSKGLSDNFISTFEKEGGKILKVLKYSQKDTSFTSQLGDVRKSKPDVLYIPGFHQQVGVILREAEDLKIKSKKLGGDGWYTPDLRKIAKGSEIGGYTSTHYSTDSDDPSVKAFVEAYTKKYKAKPSAHAALGYDSYKIIHSIIKEIKSSDPEKINNALANLKDFKGITGSITMDKNHNPIKPAVILEYIPNGYKFITSIKPKVSSN